MQINDISPTCITQGKEKPEDNRIVIVIGRQFGSGGRSIGKLVAKKLGIRYYDSELLNKCAEMSGYSKHIFSEHDEKAPTPLRSLLQGAFGLADNFHDVSICSERIYSEQSKTIRDICRRESCVIVGRTADYIMRDHPGLISVFLHSPLEKRARDLVSRGEAYDLGEAIEKAKKQDKYRESYYNFYTGGNNWGKANNYGITIDSSLTGHEGAAEIIVAFTQSKIKRQK